MITTKAQSSRLSANAGGALWMIAAAVFFSLNAAIVKQLGATGIDSLQTVFARSVMGLLVPLAFVLAARTGVRTRHVALQLLQGLVGTIALMSHFFAWTKLPLA